MNVTTEFTHKFTGKTKVYLADDHEIFRTGLRTILRYAGDLEISGESAIATDFVDRLAAAEPDVLLLGSRPDLTETIDSIKNRLPGLKILVLGAAGDVNSNSIEILDGYINKDSSSEFLRSAIRTVVLGGTVWHPGIVRSQASKTISYGDPSDQTPASIVVTPREKRLLVFVAEGKTNKQIALELSIAQITVKKALQSLYIKLGSINRTQAVMKASQLGLV